MSSCDKRILRLELPGRMLGGKPKRRIMGVVQEDMRLVVRVRRMQRTGLHGGGWFAVGPPKGAEGKEDESIKGPG